MNSLRPSAAGVPERTSNPDGSNRSRCGFRELTNWPGPSAGVPVSSRKALAVSATLIVYQSSWLVTDGTKSNRVTRPLRNAEPTVSLTEALLKIRHVTFWAVPTAPKKVVTGEFRTKMSTSRFPCAGLKLNELATSMTMSNGKGEPTPELDRLSRPSNTVTTPAPTLLANTVEGVVGLLAE